MINIVENFEPDIHWNERLLKAKIGTMAQTKERAVNFTRRNEIPLFLHFIDDSGEIVGQNLIGILPRFTTRKSKAILRKLPGIKNLTYSWTYGPIIFEHKKSNEILFTFKNYLLSKKSRIHGGTNPLLFFNNSIFEKNFNIQEWATSIIDLSLSLDELYKKISKNNGRKNIQRSINRGVEIELIDKNNLYDYHLINNELRTKIGTATADYEKYVEWWDLMQPIGYAGFLAKKNGNPIGGMLFSYFNKIIVEAGVARSELDHEEKLHSQDLIKWKIIEWGHNNGMDFYDLAGYNPLPINSKEDGIKSFKEKWGGEKYSYWIVKK